VYFNAVDFSDFDLHLQITAKKLTTPTIFSSVKPDFLVPEVVIGDGSDQPDAL